MALTICGNARMLRESTSSDPGLASRTIPDINESSNVTPACAFKANEMANVCRYVQLDRQFPLLMQANQAKYTAKQASLCCSLFKTCALS